MNGKQGIRILITIFVLASCIVNSNNGVSACDSEIKSTTSSITPKNNISIVVHQNKASVKEGTTCTPEGSTSTPSNNNCASNTPGKGTDTPSSEGQKPGCGDKDPGSSQVEYVFYRKGDSVQHVADKIREYINKYNATSINGHPVSESNIEDVARKIMEEADNSTDSYDKNKLFIIIFACTVSMLFGGKLRFNKK